MRFKRINAKIIRMIKRSDSKEQKVYPYKGEVDKTKENILKEDTSNHNGDIFNPHVAKVKKDRNKKIILYYVCVTIFAALLLFLLLFFGSRML